MNQMLKAVLLATILAKAITGIVADKKVVCYYGSWAAYRLGLGKFEPSDINPTLCTHVIYTFVGITPDGKIRIVDSWLDLPDGKDGFGEFIKLRDLSPGTKAMIAIGGWNEGSVTFSQVARSPELRAQFVEDAVEFLKTYHFDGLDVDWEYPSQRGGHQDDKKNFVALLKELKQAFDKNGYILSVAVGAAQSSASESYDIAELSQYVDFINLMTYDFNGSWNPNTGLNAPLHASPKEEGDQATLNVHSAVQYWLSQGAPAGKLILGIPSYGRSFTLTNPTRNHVGAPATGPGKGGPYTKAEGMLGYNEICEKLLQGWAVRRDYDHGVPYAVSGNQWVSYDDTTSVAEKVKYALSNGLGGVMMWSVETDDFRGTCGEKYPLLKTINGALKRRVREAPVPQLAKLPEKSPPGPPATGRLGSNKSN